METEHGEAVRVQAWPSLAGSLVCFLLAGFMVGEATQYFIFLIPGMGFAIRGYHAARSRTIRSAALLLFAVNVTGCVFFFRGYPAG
jgi:hypothetical protein